MATATTKKTTSKRATTSDKKTSSGYQSKKELKDGTGYCTRCQRILTINKFWLSDSIVDGSGYHHLCVDCMNDIFNDVYKKHHNVTDDFVVNGKNIVFDIDTELAFREVCKLLDISFKYDAYESCQSHVESCKSANRTVNKILGIYKSKLSSTTVMNGKLNEKLIYANSDKSRIIEDVKKHMYDGFEADEEMIKFWGKTKKEELEFLENEWYNLTTRFECESYSTEMLFQEIALTRLDIKNKRNQGQNVDKELKTLQDLLGSANIKPVQETGANAGDQLTYGNWIKKLENTRPVSEPEDSFKDVDGIMKYISIWFFGHMCKMLGIKNDYSKMYEEEMAKYRVSVDENYTEDDDSDLSSILGGASDESV